MCDEEVMSLIAEKLGSDLIVKFIPKVGAPNIIIVKS